MKLGRNRKRRGKTTWRDRETVTKQRQNRNQHNAGEHSQQRENKQQLETSKTK